MKTWTDKDLNWKWSYTLKAMAYFVAHSSGPLYMGRSKTEALESIECLNKNGTKR